MASTTSRRITRKPLNAIVRRRVSALLFLCISALFFFAFVRVFYAAKNGNGRRDGDDASYVKFELQKQGEEGMKESSSHAIESAETTSSSSTSNETIDVGEDVLDGSGDDDGEQRNKSRSRESRSREECETSSRTVALNTEYAGDVVHWGDTNIQDTSKACCEMCYETKTCNVWVYNPQTKKCWLKKQKDLYEGVQPGTMATGWQIVWTSGTVGPYLVRPKDGGKMEDIEETEKTKLVDVRKNLPSLPIHHEMRIRECGSPAVDGYAHVVPECLVNSTTNKDFDSSETSRLEQVAWLEKHASYDGLAVRWGIGHKAGTAEECAQKCREHQPGRHGGPFSALPCNVFVWCDVSNDICFEPDAHVHTAGDCWLKFSEAPESVEVNQRGSNDDPFDGFLNSNKLPYKMRHAKAPEKAHWTSGVLLPKDWVPSNGTLGPRAKW